jgi:glycosyltransferase involved in cell wall biosynthesis
MNQPLVSVILPAYNAAATLERAVRSALDQSLTDFEVILLDDGSKDGTASLGRALAEMDARVRFHPNELNLGIQKTLNVGLSLARGKYIARLDADDAWAGRDKLARQVEFFESHPDHVICGTGIIVVDERGSELLRYHKPQSDAAIRAAILGQNPFAHPSVMFRAATVAALGGYDESPTAKHVEDYELWLRLGTKGKMANLPSFGLLYTQSAGQISSRHSLTQYSRNLALAWRFRNDYPGFVRSLVRNLGRCLCYGARRRA